ncbi:hypothetical protein GCM10010912_22790 [Paenibacillus albidus]|uniref:Uncharacterized protein n=1 Tax=Paenibacillus albidus TaxID=2041023 RepID=A0A917FEX6_9BACL|nr:hypothetical protein [Paenibacillus albidus]GGF77156.1 hypothetical protein GCM10010912_22790 [Paenibacillus albidus]
MQIGMKIYFDKTTGNVILNTGEYVGRGYVETTEDQDFASYKELAQRIRETVGVVKLQYGQYSREFAQCDSYRVNPDNSTLEFTYPGPQVDPMRERVEALEAQNEQLAADLKDTQVALTDNYEELQAAKQEAADAQLALAELYELVIAGQAGQQPEAPTEPEQPAEGGDENNG